MPRASAVSPDQFGSFGDLLKHLRRRAGLTQRELSIAVGYSDTQLSRMEQNQRVPDQATLTARFVPALEIEHEPAVVARLLALARAAREGASPPPQPPVLPPPAATPHNLPQALTTFIGREQEIAEVKRLIASARLVTLTGAGGSGKTRLALQTAAEVRADYPDGAWLADLAPLADPRLVTLTVATVVGAAEQPGQPPLVTLTEHFRSRTVLLVLDNCEHVVEACAQLAEAVLSTCPKVTIVATSREALGIDGEMLFSLPTLAWPDPRLLANVTPDGATLERLSQYDAMRLFLERAKAVAAGYRLTADNALAVAQICQQLDGIPLAIELAAARVKVLSAGQIAARLAEQERFNLLIGGRRTALPRHQTLRAMIDWSHALLNEKEQAVFRRVAAFAGGFTLTAVTAVCAGDGIEAGEVLDLLSHLVDKSLVVVEPGLPGREPRYRLLETIRQYALAKLEAAREADAAQARHALHFLSLAEEAEPWLKTRDRDQWMARLDAEHDNLRAALAWSAESASDDETMARLAWALLWFWLHGGHVTEGRGWLAGALARAANHAPLTQAKVLCAAGQLAIHQNESARAAAMLEESLQLWRASGSAGEEGLAYTLVIRATLVRWHGDPATARALAEEAVTRYRGQGNRWGVAFGLGHLGLAIRDLEDFGLARAMTEEAVALWKEMDDLWGLQISISCLANVVLRQGDYAAAQQRFAETLAICRSRGDEQAAAAALHDLGLTMLNLGDAAAARPFFEEALASARERNAIFGMASNALYLGILALYDGDDTLAEAHFRQAFRVPPEIGPLYYRGDCLKGIAGLAAVRGQARRAAKLWGAAEGLLAAASSYMDNGDCIFFGRIMTTALAELGDVAFEAERAEGRELTAEQAVAYALAEPTQTQHV